jgi:hypothetical protein
MLTSIISAPSHGNGELCKTPNEKERETQKTVEGKQRNTYRENRINVPASASRKSQERSSPSHPSLLSRTTGSLRFSLLLRVSDMIKPFLAKSEQNCT